MSRYTSPTESNRRMPSLWRLLALAGAMAALTALAPAVSAAPGGHQGREFHLSKTCDNSGCTVQSSTDKAIEIGTLITYQGATPDALVATINADHGTAVGDCNIASVFEGTGPGHCVFTGGDGSLKDFRITVAVTLDFDTGIWYWDGTFDRGQSSQT